MNTDQHWHELHQPLNTAMQIKIAYAGVDFKDLIASEMPQSYNFMYASSCDALHELLTASTILEQPDVIILELDANHHCFSFIERIRNEAHMPNVVIVLLSKYDVPEWKARAVKLKVHDYYLYPFSISHLNERIKLLLKLRLVRPHDGIAQEDHTLSFNYKLPFAKRLFDIVLSASILIFLFPIFLIVGLCIFLESDGPVIYKSRRVGSAYKIFDFYKFRSMVVGADAKIAEQTNLYQTDTTKAVFFKVMNDPRITKFGQFIRNTSIDELPQLYNILIGDMSFVGNRPLPLYEAEQLTSNEWSKRFLGPAGLTGLWQIMQRGKDTVTERERKELDNYYAASYSFTMDLKILLKTFSAVMQKVKV